MCSNVMLKCFYFEARFYITITKHTVSELNTNRIIDVIEKRAGITRLISVWPL